MPRERGKAGSEAFFGSTIFCDDIRGELGGKFSLIGIYQAHMKVHAPFPLVLPKLGVWITYQEPWSEPPTPLQLRVFLPGDPDDTPTFRVDIPEDPIPTTERDRSVETLTAAGQRREDVRRTMNFNFVISPCPLKEAGLIKVRMQKGESVRRLGTLLVQGA